MDIYGYRGLDSKGQVSVSVCVSACVHLSIGSECKERAKWDAFQLRLHKGWPHGNTAMNLFESEGTSSHLGMVRVTLKETTTNKTM